MSLLAFDPWAILAKFRTDPAPPRPLQACASDGLSRPPDVPDMPGVPSEWTRGVRALAAMACPARIEPERWAAFVATAGRLLIGHGAALHAAGWGTLDLFGLDQVAPSTHCPSWGLAWLLETDGTVLDAGEGVVGMRRQPGGTRMGFRPRTRGRAVPAWDLAD